MHKRVGILGGLSPEPTVTCCKRITLARAGIETLVPEPSDHERINGIIFGELRRGVRRPESHRFLQTVMEGLCRRGAGGMIPGCMEIPLLITQKDCRVPLFDTTALHAQRTLDCAISRGGNGH